MALFWFSFPATPLPVTRRSMALLATALLVCPLTPMAAKAQSLTQTAGIPDVQLTEAEIDASPRIALAGNTRPEANVANDLGEVDDSLPMEHVLLQLQRLPADQAALDAWVASLSDQSSPEYHHWLTSDEYGRRFGLARPGLDRVTDWLLLHGLTVHGVYPNRMLIDFSATAGQIRETFGTEIHAYEVAGARHIANATDPTVPAALAPWIAGIVSLHDFRPQPLSITHPRGSFTAGSGQSKTWPVTASDLGTIYNLTPLFKAGYTGKGETIAVVADSDVYSAGDWSAFRSAFGLSGYSSGSLQQMHPGSGCSDPGAIAGWDEEPILDAEYASAAAPGATIQIAACKSTSSTSGVMIALVNVVNAASRPAVLSVSYGTCEAANGAGANATIQAAYQQAVAEGVSVFAASGDGGGAFCDVGKSASTHGIGVNAYASTAYNVAVGGTDFSDTYSHSENNYWNNGNSSTGSSAKSYIPEIPWDDSCASPLIAEWNGYKTTFGSLGFCLADLLSMDQYQTTIAGSGGPSGCAAGKASLSLVVSGSCRGVAKPAWQAVSGNPKDGARDLPDVALFAADGIWGHYFLFCDSNLNDADGAPCKGNSVANWSEGGGTSFAAPIMAGIQALIAQKWGRQGNPNPIYYKLAAAQLASNALQTGCNASNGVGSSSGCVFHDVTQGSSDVNCQGLLSCYLEVLSTSSLWFGSAYPAQAGWDFATGLGSVNAYNLVMNPAW